MFYYESYLSINYVTSGVQCLFSDVGIIYISSL